MSSRPEMQTNVPSEAANIEWSARGWSLRAEVMCLLCVCAVMAALSLFPSGLLLIVGGLAPLLFIRLGRHRRVQASSIGVRLDGRLFAASDFRGVRLGALSGLATLTFEGRRALDGVRLGFDDAEQARAAAMAAGFGDPTHQLEVATASMRTRVAYWSVMVAVLVGFSVGEGLKLLPLVVQSAPLSSDQFAELIVYVALHGLLLLGAIATAAWIALGRFDWIVVTREGLRMRSTCGAGDRFVAHRGIVAITRRGRKILVRDDRNRTYVVRAEGIAAAVAAENALVARVDQTRTGITGIDPSLERDGRSIETWVRSLRESAHVAAANYRRPSLSEDALLAALEGPGLSRAQRIAVGVAASSLNADASRLVRAARAGGDPVIERVMARITDGAPDAELAAELEQMEQEEKLIARARARA